MSARTARWVAVAVVGLAGVILVGDVILLGLLPFVVVAAIVTFVFAADGRNDGPATHVRSQLRRQLLMGTPDSAAELITPMLSARSASKRRFAAEMLVLAVQAGADDPRVLDALPRLVGLAPTYRIGRALLAHGRSEEAIEVLNEAADGHDPVAWAEYVGALAGAGRFDDVRAAIARTSQPPSVESALHAVRRLDDLAGVDSVRQGLADRLGEDSPAVVLLDVKLGRAEERLTAFVAAHQTTDDAALAAWVAWAGAALGSQIALEHLERLVGQAAPGRISVGMMLASVQLGRPEIALRIAPSALNRARIDARAALHVAHAQALAATGRSDEAIAALHLVPTDLALVAALTPPLAPNIRDADGYTALVDHIVKT